MSIFKVHALPNPRVQEGFEAVLHQSRDSGKFWGALRAGELIPLPLTPGIRNLSAYPRAVQKECSHVDSEWVE